MKTQNQAQNKTGKKSSMNVQMMSKLAMMTAVSIVLLLIVRIPFPPLPFLIYDPADVPIYITAYAYGPGAGLIVTFVVSFIQATMLGGDGLYGFLMHFVATGTVAVVIGALYRRNKTRKTAITSLAIGVVLSIAIMAGMNLLITPVYMGIDRAAVAAMLPTAIIPFNLIKSVLNASLTFLLYKRVSGFLHNNAAGSK